MLVHSLKDLCSFAYAMLAVDCAFHFWNILCNIDILP